MNKKQKYTQREISEKLWSLLDDIDTASDMFKPCDSNIDSYKNFYNFAMKKQSERFKYMQSNGYDILTNEEYEMYEKVELEKIPHIGKNVT